MSWTTHPRRLTAVVLTATVAIVAALLVAGPARSTPGLPDVGAQELVRSAIEAGRSDVTISGDVRGRVDLGLPLDELAALQEAQSGPPRPADDGELRLRLASSPDGLRLALREPDRERALVASTDEAWLWDSDTLTATRVAPPADGDRERAAPMWSSLDPLTLAGDALAAVEPTTRVSVRTTGEVAGRATYGLVLEPRTEETLVGRVRIDLDGERRVPLAVEVTARGATEPAIEVAFERVSFDELAADTFDFTPPPGTTVKELPTGQDHGRRPPSGDRPVVLGDGWTTVVAIPVPGDLAADRTGARAAEELLPWSGTLLSARRVGDHLLVGPVPQAGLEAAAATLPS